MAKQDQANVWFTAPIDVIAPFSYGLQFTNAPIDYVVEAVIPVHVHKATDGWSWGIKNQATAPKVRTAVLPMDQWAGFAGWCQPRDIKGQNYEFAGSNWTFPPTVIAETANGGCVVLSTCYGFDEINGLVHHLRCGECCPPIYSGSATVVREPSASYPDDWPDTMPLYAGSIVRYVDLAGEFVPVSAKRGAVRHGLVIGDNGRLVQWDEWSRFFDQSRWYPGLEKMRERKGRVADRFTEEDLREALLVLGIDMYNPEFYTGKITVIESFELLTPLGDTSFLEAWRDEIMPGWREDWQRWRQA